MSHIPSKNNGVPRTLGPIPDLERHLPSDWWRTLFNSVYLKTDGDVVENAVCTRADVDVLLQLTGLKPHHRLLDLCCGQGRHCLELARRGYQQITGIDRSRYLIRLARKRATKAKLSIQFHEGDARKIRPHLGLFDGVCLLGNSFGYFDREEDDLAVLRQIYAVLNHRGMLYLDVANGDYLKTHFEPRSWEWIDQNQFVCRERSLSSDRQRLISREVVTHAEKGVLVDQFYAERLYDRPSLTILLQKAGFDTIAFHDLDAPDSSRNQDLGMLASRLVCTAKVSKTSLELLVKQRQTTVTVLLGDPTLPDPIKRDQQFNPEDLETVTRLKTALEQIPGYEWQFLDRHASLMATLMANPPAFVLNLCDEGFVNNPFFELHIPALLEMLGIPYTGAGPACLALCYNKAAVSAIASALDIPVPAQTYCHAADQAANLPSILPALIKPNYGDSSIGITQAAIVHNPQELLDRLAHLHLTLPNIPILIQEFLTGPEYTVAILGNSSYSYEILPILEVDYSALPPHLPPILSYESKWEPDSPYWNEIKYREAQVDEDTRRRLWDYASRLFEHLGCRDYARFDFRADRDGEIKLLEANPNPGWCWDGKLNLMAELRGMTYSQLLQHIIEAAQNRFP